jgi:hypothetical protein
MITHLSLRVSPLLKERGQRGALLSRYDFFPDYRLVYHGHQRSLFIPGILINTGYFILPKYPVHPGYPDQK